MIYTVTLNPALDKTVEIPSLRINEVNRITSMRTDPGGKGINVSKVISKLHGASVVVGILGGNTGRAILAALKELGLETCFHFVEGETRTNMKIVDPEMHTNTDINEPGVTVSEEILRELLAELQQLPILFIKRDLPRDAAARGFVRQPLPHIAEQAAGRGEEFLVGGRAAGAR